MAIRGITSTQQEEKYYKENNMYYDKINNSSLVGLVVREIDVDDCGDSLRITTECGRAFMFYHDQDCCEDVRIWDIKGNLNLLKGKRLESVESEILDDIPDDVDYKPYDSYTWTEITFRVTDATVISRWIGESNGYYSEAVDLSEL